MPTAAAAVRPSPSHPSSSPLSTTFSFHTPDTTSSNFSRSPDHLHTSPQQTILNLRTELALALNTVSKLSEENFDLSERVRELEDENQVLLIQMRDLEREQSIDHGWDEDKEGLTRDWQRKVSHQQTIAATHPHKLRYTDSEQPTLPFTNVDSFATVPRRASLASSPSLPNLRPDPSLPAKVSPPARPLRSLPPIISQAASAIKRPTTFSGRRHSSSLVTLAQPSKRIPLSPLTYHQPLANAAPITSSAQTRKGPSSRPSPLSQCSCFSSHRCTSHRASLSPSRYPASSSLSPTSAPLPPSQPTSPALPFSPGAPPRRPSLTFTHTDFSLCSTYCSPRSTSLSPTYEDDEAHETHEIYKGLGIAESFNTPLQPLPPPRGQQLLQHCPLSASAFTASSTTSSTSPNRSFLLSSPSSSPLAPRTHPQRRPTNPLGRATPSPSKSLLISSSSSSCFSPTAAAAAASARQTDLSLADLHTPPRFRRNRQRSQSIPLLTFSPSALSSSSVNPSCDNNNPTPSYSPYNNACRADRPDASPYFSRGEIDRSVGGVQYSTVSSESSFGAGADASFEAAVGLGLEWSEEEEEEGRHWKEKGKGRGRKGVGRDKERMVSGTVWEDDWVDGG